MDQTATGRFIARKRKEQNWTQEQLAEKIGVSSKTVSKWERGKCMPDYSIIQTLCDQLGISLSELMDGEEKSQDSIRTYDDEQILDLLERIQSLEKHKKVQTSFIIIVTGIALQALSHMWGGSEFSDFASGILLGLSVGIILTGIFMLIKNAAEQ